MGKTLKPPGVKGLPGEDVIPAGSVRSPAEPIIPYAEMDQLASGLTKEEAAEAGPEVVKTLADLNADRDFVGS